MVKTLQVPADVMRLRLGAAQFADAEPSADGSGKTCRLVARSDKPVIHPWLNMPIWHDLAGMQRTRDRLPLDWLHDPNELLGWVEGFDVADGQLTCEGTVFSVRSDDRAAEVLARAAAGQPYECSIKFDEGLAEEVHAGMTAEVNGQEIAGPALIFREWLLRGVALCPYGMDARTNVEFSDDPKRVATIRILPKEGQMSAEKEKELAAENEELKKQLADLQAQLKALAEPDPKEKETPEEVREELSRQAAEYMAKFGEQGAAWFAARKPLAECYGEYQAKLTERHAGELAAVQAKVTELTARLTALGDKGGELTPVSGGVAGGAAGGDPNSAGEYAHVLPSNLARVAAGIKMPAKQ